MSLAGNAAAASTAAAVANASAATAAANKTQMCALFSCKYQNLKG